MRDEETDVQIDPPCIWLIQIPFADDIRYPTIDECQSVVDIDGKPEFSSELILLHD